MGAAFADNAIVIQAHLLGKEYGCLPSEVMDMRSDFWFNAQARLAGLTWEREQGEMTQEATQGAGAATGQQKQEMVDAQEERAEQREQGQPSLQEQLATVGGTDGR